MIKILIVPLGYERHGRLSGYRAATHWSAMDYLVPFGAIPTKTRVCIDRNRITGGGVTAGIDFGLRLAAELSSETIAKEIQLGLEYNPDPPFRSGHPDVAEPAVVDTVRTKLHQLLDRRREQIRALV